MSGRQSYWMVLGHPKEHGWASLVCSGVNIVEPLGSKYVNHTYFGAEYMNIICFGIFGFSRGSCFGTFSALLAMN